MVIGATVSGLSSDTRRRLLGCLLSRSNRCDAADALVHPEQLPVCERALLSDRKGDMRYRIRGAISEDLGQRSIFLLLLTATVELPLYCLFKLLKSIAMRLNTMNFQSWDRAALLHDPQSTASGPAEKPDSSAK